MRKTLRQRKTSIWMRKTSEIDEDYYLDDEDPEIDEDYYLDDEDPEIEDEDYYDEDESGEE